ncbi:MAG: hypothetical protein IJK66_06165 [Bacilli bacterium]|nr:hypothetical protein [Bacilli bacterium]
MKKNVLLIVLVIILFFTIVGCSVQKEKNDNVNSNNKSVVLYFSATGTTKKIAERIARESNSDIIKIIPEEEYKKEDLNYNSDCRANREQNDSKSRPKIKNAIDINKYDTIYLGYPIWWGTNPKIILTLLDTYDFTNKIIIPFCTSGSTEISGSVEDLRKYNPNLNIKDGKRFSTNDSDEVIKEFINRNEIDKSNEVINSVKIIINDKEYIIKLEDNETVKSFINILPQELNMSELNGNEKYIYLDNILPTNSFNPKKINAGDVMLYGNNCLVIFYKSFDTSYSYTKIGHIDNLPNLGNSNITVKFEK